MRYGYWLPVFGGWLRNVEDEGMEASWPYVSRLERFAESVIRRDASLVAAAGAAPTPAAVLSLQ